MKGWITAVVLGVAMLAGACAQSDAGISTSVKSKLIADDQIKARNINVDTKDRIVTLTGEVQSPAEETKAVELARATEGVADVVNRLTIQAPAEPLSAPTSGRSEDTAPARDLPGSDAGVTAEIKTRLLADPAVSGLAINVDTLDHVVTLTGAVKSRAEKARALEIARGVERVTRVEDKLTVNP